MHHIPSACMLMLAPTPQSIKHVNMYIPVHVQCIHVYAAQTEVWACGSACVHGRLGDGGGGGRGRTDTADAEEKASVFPSANLHYVHTITYLKVEEYRTNGTYVLVDAQSNEDFMAKIILF